MKILSIDIGIKNLAYCLLETTGDSSFKILQWEVINLCGEPPTCIYMIRNRKSCKKCNKKASLTKNSLYYCKTHAKKTDYIIPSAETRLLSNTKLNTLVKLAETYNLQYPLPARRTTIKDILITHFKNNMFDPVLNISANDVSLVDIGIALSIRFTETLNMQDIDQVIIENQLSPLASRMKTIQGMVAQYFIMNNIFNICFVSAMNKLKPFTKEKLNYKARKAYSIQVTSELLHNDIMHQRWIPTFHTHNKKDDLADSFLQALWFLYDKDLFSYKSKQVCIV